MPFPSPYFAASQLEQLKYCDVTRRVKTLECLECPAGLDLLVSGWLNLSLTIAKGPHTTAYVSIVRVEASH